MKKIYLSFLIILTGFATFAQLNIQFKSNLSYNGLSLSNIGGFVDSSGNEYALVGYYDGLDIVDVTDPTNPVSKFIIPGNQSDWREVKTWNGFAYITTEACCDGLQIVDLRFLPDSISTGTYTGDGPISSQLETIHALHIDDGYAYLYGSNLFNGAAVIVDLADPFFPAYQGHTVDNGGNNDSYIHDGYVRNDTLWGGYIYDGYFSVTDVSDKTAPVTLTTQTTPNNFTHNTWLSQDSRTLFTTDETNNSYLTSYDVSDISNIKELDRIQSNPGSGVIVHNTHIINVGGNDYAVTSWYKDGVVITDVGRPDNMVNVGNYDTYTQGSGPNFDGDWGVYPYLPSGNLVCSDMANGLYVLAPTYIRACYLEGIVTDSVSGVLLNNVNVAILLTPVTEQTKLNGVYKTGYASAGTYDVTFSKPGYITKTISGVVLSNGLVTNLNVQLVSIPTVTISGQVTNSINGTPVTNATVLFTNSQFNFNLTTDGAGNFSVSNFYPETYNLFSGVWNYITYCDTGLTINGSTGPINIQLTPGIYDDFTFDYGWTVSGASGNSWVREVPIATYFNGANSNPGLDVNNDCDVTCYITDNGGGGAWDNDVDGGNTVLTSPVFNPTYYVDPEINYSRWFANLGNNGGGSPDDTLTVKLSNGTTTVTLETVLNNTPQNGTWVNKKYNIASLLPVTSTMQLIVETADYGPTFNVVEGGLDKFFISEGPQSVKENGSNLFALTASPNPFNTEISIHYKMNILVNKAEIMVTDLTGRVMEKTPISASEGNFITGKKLSPGVYFVSISNEKGQSSIIKLVKTK